MQTTPALRVAGIALGPWALTGLVLGMFAVSAKAQGPAPERPAIKFSVVRASTGGVYVYAPEKWGILHIDLVNTRDEPRELMCATYFDGHQTLQFGRKVWVPAHAKLRTGHPILIPQHDPSQGRTLRFHSLVLDASGKGEFLEKSETGELLHDGSLLVTHTKQISGMIDELDGRPSEQSDAAYDLMVACRVDQSLGRQLALVADQFIAPDSESLQALDHLLIAGNRILNDEAALAAVRQWLHAGGRLWVMLDRTDPRVLEMLLGDEFSCHVVDHVGLTSVRVDPVVNTSGSQSPTTEFEEPVELARAVVTGATVTHSVNGWPAAFWKNCGDGRLLVTTLGAKGWMHLQSAIEPPMQPPGQNIADPLAPGFVVPDARNFSLFVPNEAMQNIASEFFNVRPPTLLPSAAVEAQVGEYVGYSIPSRGLIGGTLGGVVLALVGVGTWFWRGGRLEHMGWIGPGLAIVASGALLYVGRSNRQNIAPTLATVQLVQAIPGTDDIRTEGTVAVFHPEGSQAPITATKGGRLVPDMSGLEGTVRRMIWTDMETWHWENVPQAAGQRITTFSRSETVENRIEARGTMDATGITGRYSAGGLKGLKDALIATRDGRIGVELREDGTFVAPAGKVFSKEQYLDATLLSDEQDRRRRTLEKLLNNPLRGDYPQQPTLMFWTEGWNSGFQFGDDLRPQGATLVTVPLTLDRPPAGSEFVITPPFLSFRNTVRPDGTPSSPLWDYTNKKWLEQSAAGQKPKPAEAWLRFRVPRELLPVEVTRGRALIQVAGKVGKFDVLGLESGTSVSQKSWIDPVGTLSVDFKSEVLTVNADGEVILGLKGGDDSPAEASPKSGSAKGEMFGTTVWQMESLSLQLWAKTTDSAEKE